MDGFAQLGLLNSYDLPNNYNLLKDYNLPNNYNLLKDYNLPNNYNFLNHHGFNNYLHNNYRCRRDDRPIYSSCVSKADIFKKACHFFQILTLIQMQYMIARKPVHARAPPVIP